MKYINTEISVLKDRVKKNSMRYIDVENEIFQVLNKWNNGKTTGSSKCWVLSKFELKIRIINHFLVKSTERETVNHNLRCKLISVHSAIIIVCISLPSKASGSR